MFRNLFSRNQEKSNTNKNKECKQYLEYKVIKEFENNECIICLECMSVNEKIKILDCGHMYHYDCINKWIEKKGEINCPLCSK